VTRARWCHTEAHFGFDILKRLGHRSERRYCETKDDKNRQVVGKTRQRGVVPTQNALIDSHVEGRHLVMSKSQWPIAHLTCPRFRNLHGGGPNCKIFCRPLLLFKSRGMIRTQPLM
jgi:hypothetical protein